MPGGCGEYENLYLAPWLSRDGISHTNRHHAPCLEIPLPVPYPLWSFGMDFRNNRRL